MSAQIRCAIYTRKSTDEGLEQDFNSLHAQREACESFIQSQRHEGWRAIRDAFDDGGFSGGTVERPALSRLLDLVKAGKVDVIVVYKVDRLTRSLADFAKIVELFDAHKVSFVSVTQQFNTTSSMGRLTLNVLLSFAQFEREVGAERIRDKIAASKKRGIWMGGLVPLGYDVRDRLLIVNETEASTVRKIYSLYRQLGTVKLLRKELDRLGVVTKVRRSPDGQTTGGESFSRGHLHEMLTNPIYIGEIAHKGVTYPGKHTGIIDRDTWTAVQQQLKENGAPRRSERNVKSASLLSGLVYDDNGDPLYTTHGSKNGRRYGYYVSKRIMVDGRAAEGGRRIPAKELETAITKAICDFLENGIRVVEALELGKAAPGVVKSAVETASDAAKCFRVDMLESARDRLRALIHRVSIRPGQLCVEVKAQDLSRALLESSSGDAAAPENIVTIDVPIALKRRGVTTKLVIRSAVGDIMSPDQGLIELVSRACRWLDDLADGRVPSVRAIAQRDGLDEGDVSRFLPLAFLAPDIVEAILEGRQPVELTPEKLKRIGSLPHGWDDQRRLLGFSP
jgi:DNA invertase Pin-like site-specific DNA recombinase